MSLTVSDICNDLKTFLESICRTCSRIDNGDGQLQLQRIFAIAAEPQPPDGDNDDDDDERAKKSQHFSENFQSNEELKDLYEELLLWKLNIKPSDGLPQQICRDCLERLRGVKHFRSLCLDTQTLLQSYISHVDTLLESGSLGRVSPKSEARASPAPSSFNVDDLVEEVPETPERQVSLSNSPLSSPRTQQLSPRLHEVVYAESSLGTPPPLFEEINTEPIDMETMDYLKAESDLEKQTKSDNDDLNMLHSFNFSSSENEESEGTVTDTETESSYVSRNPLQCKICYDVFPKRFLLKEHHLRAHPQEKPYACNICSSAFKSNFLLSQHKLKHNRRDTIKCGECSKYFRSQLHLQRHTKNFHLTSTYTCHICHAKFENYTQIRFQYHVRQHGEKRFHCQFCEKSFHQKIHLINHERTHTKEQPFRCDVCGKCYRQQTACREHMLTHDDPTPFKCKICQKGFTQRSSLRLHYRGHTNGKVAKKKSTFFHCELCGQNFSKKSHFELHQVKHTTFCAGLEAGRQTPIKKSRGQSLKLFDCKFCDKTFSKQQKLLLHVQQYHTADEDEEENGILYRASLGQHMLSHLDVVDNNRNADLINYDFSTAT